MGIADMLMDAALTNAACIDRDNLREELETLKAKVKEYLIVDEDEDREQDPSEKLRELAKELWELGK